MNQYSVRLEALTPLIMHQDNLTFGERVKAWQKDPANKELSFAGDDRSPAWTWLGYLYHNRQAIGIPSDNLMTCLREGGTQLKTGRPGKGSETYKKATQSGIVIDQEQFTLLIDGKEVPIGPLDKLGGNTKFDQHLDVVEKMGFELLVKRAKVGSSKHVRVRPLFRNWEAVGTLTVIDEELSGLTQTILQKILDQAGALAGLCDWRPSSPKASGSFGKFVPHIELM